MANKRMCEHYPTNLWVVFVIQWTNGSHSVVACKNTVDEFFVAADAVGDSTEVEAYSCRTISDMKAGDHIDTEDKFTYIKVKA